MTARILVVDDVEANVRLLEAKLTLEYYEVLTAPDDDKKVELVITTAPNVRHRFRLGTGLKEQFVEDWVDLTRTAAALEGVFLPPLS